MCPDSLKLDTSRGRNKGKIGKKKKKDICLLQHQKAKFILYESYN